MGGRVLSDPPGAAMTRPSPNPWLVLLVLCLGFFMILLDSSVVNIAIPSIIDDLHASLDQILWVLNAYIVVYAVLLITAGRLGDYYGRRNLFVGGLIVFTAASVYCGLAPDATHLVVARVMQGIGGAVLTPQTLSIIMTIFPPYRRGAAFGVWSAVAGLGTIVGPTLGGFVVTDLGWRWIFFINLPIGIIALIGALRIVPSVRPGTRHALDMGGVLLASAGLLAIVFGLVEGERYHWGALLGPLTIPELVAVGLVALIGFVLWE